jgi:hypothetical protein
MKKSEPTYVTFEQAKWLFEIGFDSDYCNHCYDTNKKLKRASVTNKWIREDGGYYNTTNLFIAPEQHQVVEWLRVNHGIWIWTEVYGLNWNYFISSITKPADRSLRTYNHYYRTPQEAYSAAFDYMRFNLTVQNNTE